MTKLSPHYRNDASDGLPEPIKDYLDRHFLKKLENLEVIHPKLLVVFSGGNGVGKSSLSQRIRQELKALVLENDAIKTSLLNYNPGLDRDTLNVLTWQYGMDLYRRLDDVTNNGLVVRDGVIDWYYDRILPVFRQQGYGFFVIGYELSPEKRIELIRQRGDKPTINVARFMKLLKDHDIHMARFRAAYTPDVMLNDENLFDYDVVVARLRERLATLQ